MLFNYELDTVNSYRAMGRFIKFYRTIAGYSLRDLGQLTNVSHTLIANIESGKINGSPDTLKELFNKLNTEYYYIDDIYEEFKESYDLVFDYLYKYEYTRAIHEMKKLLEKEDIYVHSILITDYGLIKFLYLTLLGKEAKDEFIDINVFRGVHNNLSDNQKQIYYLIEGVNNYNQGMFHDSIEFLKKALKVGNSNLDYLVKVYLTKNYVKTHRFMQVVKVGNEIIDFFEDKVIYLRAMEVRLSIAYSMMINRNYKDALNLLNSVYQFSYNFNAVYLIEEAKLLLGSYYLFQKDFEEAKRHLLTSKLNTPIVYFLKIRVALRENNKDEALRLYHEFKESNAFKLKKEEMIIDIILREAGLIEMSDEEYIKNLLEIIQIGETANDIEIVDSCYNFLIRYYQSKRMYKKALDASLKAREVRRFGCLKYK